LFSYVMLAQFRRGGGALSDAARFLCATSQARVCQMFY
jgi:hypothetical protein